MDRQQIEIIKKDLSKKIVFLTGPRQVGKTWLAKELIKHTPNSLYLNFDLFEHREIILKKKWPKSTTLLVLDELHKMPKWKNFLKGVFDTKVPQLNILVTGSVRFETFRKAGDSLAGRYFLHHLMPFTPDEIQDAYPEPEERLLKRGGFPEPFFAESDDEADRWRQQYADSMIRIDIPDAQHLLDFHAISLVFERLRRSVGSTVSYESIARDIQIAPNTVKRYINVLEDFYLIFVVRPHTQKIARTSLKKPKVYFYDTGMVIGDAGAKFENHVAVSLLKQVLLRRDTRGKETTLHYLKTKDKKEVDFCLCENNTILFLIEAKISDHSLAAGLCYFSKKYHLTGYQLVQNLAVETSHQDINICQSQKFLRDFDFANLISHPS